jgi:restriction system protein
MSRTWMVRAGRDAVLIDDFREQSLVSIGWHELGPFSSFSSKEELARAVAARWPTWNKQSQAMSTGQVWRFKEEIRPGDQVVSYDPSQRVYLVGTVTGPYAFIPERGEHPNVLPVKWDGEVSRDLLSATTKNSLGAISTIFLVPPEAAADLSRAMTSKQPAEVVDAIEAADDDVIVEDVQARALEFVKDRAVKLDWDQMQRLVAGLLRAMGYKTRVSPAGPDRGKDIVASPDGLGFESPRIVVEVKHRQGAMGSQEIRSFLGGRHKDDKGLYVSTGGFTKDARYEAERASIPLSLMDIDELVEAVIENYEELDNETRQLLPLRRIYWPT